MKTITKYVAYTGAEFTSETECLAHEAKSKAADAIVAQLVPRPKGSSCDFENGSGFIQQESKTFFKVRRELLELAKTETNMEWIQQSIDDPTVHPSWAGRIISESDNTQLARAWYRICCIDKDFREWGQPYYADHPEEATSKKLN